MAQADWDMPRTEEGLQKVLQRLEQVTAAGDLIEMGHGYLALSFLVKWVRSDTEKSPFERGHELNLMAVDVFRQAGEKKGLIRALVAATAMQDKRTTQEMLSEAQGLAEDLGDENSLAMILAARSRGLAMSDRAGADALNRQALDIYRRTGNKGGQARCLFGMAIGAATSLEKQGFAMEAAQLYRDADDHAEASRCMSVAFLNAQEIEPLTDLEPLAQQGLQDAQRGGNLTQEMSFYAKLARINAAKGLLDEAEKYRRWEKELQEADGLTPLERWKNDVEMSKWMISMMKSQGNREAVKAFQEELKRLKADKPKGNQN